MGEFFHGGRRKSGIVTLVLALLFMTGWVRSVITHDFISVYNISGQSYSVENGSLAGVITGKQSMMFLVFDTSGNGRTIDFVDDLPMSIHFLPDWRWLWSPRYESTATLLVMAVPATALPTPAVAMLPVVVIPFWTVVIPLTLLSAHLLLVKPRVAKTLVADDQKFP